MESSQTPEQPLQTIAGSPTGIGLGLRWAFLDDVLDEDEAARALPDALAFFEVSPENYMRRGGYFPEALHTVGARHRLLTHGLMMNIGGQQLDRAYLDQLRAFLDELGARYHSDHLCWTGHDGRCLQDLLPLPLADHVADHVADNIRRVQDHLGRPFAVENISYYASPGLATARTPAAGEELAKRELAFTRRVLERADCKLLLDVNNVHVNAQNHGFDAWRFIEGLPLERVIQLHVAGGERREHLDDLIIDSHGADVCPEVQELMGRVIERAGPLPVLYERDHSIPPLTTLGRQVEALDRVYQAALQRRARAPDDPVDAPESAPASAGERAGSLAGFQRGLSRVILDRAPREALETDGEDFFRARGLSEDDARAIATIGAARLEVYRRLPRNGVFNVIAEFIPRARARLERVNAACFDRDFARWMEQQGPRSRYLRDLPFEFVAWIGPRWLEDPEVPDYLVDLARHELVEFEVAAAPDAGAPAPEGQPFALDRGLKFDASARRVCYRHAVHELPGTRADDTVPAAELTRLLVYRDREHGVRFLKLSRVADALIERLLERGQVVKDALIEGARDAEEPLNDELLGRMSVLLADLAERGVVSVP